MVNERWAVRSVARGDPGDVHTASGGLYEGGRAGAGVGAGAGAGAVVRRRRFCSGTGQILHVRWHSMSRRLQCVETTGVQSRPTAS
jgi:hypothetical protein